MLNSIEISCHACFSKPTVLSALTILSTALIITSVALFALKQSPLIGGLTLGTGFCLIPFVIEGFRMKPIPQKPLSTIVEPVVSTEDLDIDPERLSTPIDFTSPTSPNPPFTPTKPSKKCLIDVEKLKEYNPLTKADLQRTRQKWENLKSHYSMPYNLSNFSLIIDVVNRDALSLAKQWNPQKWENVDWSTNPQAFSITPKEVTDFLASDVFESFFPSYEPHKTSGAYVSALGVVGVATIITAVILKTFIGMPSMNFYTLVGAGVGLIGLSALGWGIKIYDKRRYLRWVGSTYNGE